MSGPSGTQVYYPSAEEQARKREAPVIEEEDETEDFEEAVQATNVNPTKKEIQDMKWIEIVPILVPWYLDLMKTTAGLKNIEAVQAVPARCAACEQNGKVPRSLVSFLRVRSRFLVNKRMY